MSLAESCKKCGSKLEFREGHCVNYAYCTNSACHYHTNAHP